jgi:hypothetical protein
MPLPERGVLLDMVGDRDLAIPREGFSTAFAPDLVDALWDVAGRLGEPAFVDAMGDSVADDHLPLNVAGIPTVNLIDFDYPAWHTSADTPARTSASSLAAVGRVVWGWLREGAPSRPR